MCRFSFAGIALALAFLAPVNPCPAGESAKELPEKPSRPLRIGAVAYGPDAVVVWRGMRRYFDRQQMPIDFVLYSNYDALVEALHTGHVDIAWNNPLAHARFHLLSGGQSQTLVMRDVDCGCRCKLIARDDSGVASLNDLAGKTVILGSRDAAEATVLPTHFLKKEGFDWGKVKILSLHKEVDERGSPCSSEHHVLEAIQKKRGDVGIISELLWNRLVAGQSPRVAGLKVIWTSPSFSHCVFSARKDFEKERAARFTRLMLAMDGKDPIAAEIMRLEDTKKWVAASPEGFEPLLQALREEATPADKAPENKPPSGKQLNDKIKEIAGRAEVLMSVRKEFATLQAVNPARNRVTLLLDGEKLPKAWDLVPDAEIKRAGWWARLDQLTLGDRVWVWFRINRHKEPIAVLMLADELSEQDIHGPGVKVEARDDQTVTIKPVKGMTWKLQAAGIFRGAQPTLSPIDNLKGGEQVYLQSAGYQARLLFDRDAFEAERSKQKAALRQRWIEQGLPGAITFLHLSGEMEFMLDHEAIRWGRSLKPGDKVTLQTEPPTPAVVKFVRPWRERTQLRLVVAGADVAELKPGQRLYLRMDTPSVEVDAALLPPDIDRPRSREERIEWFLSSIYCACKARGDVCTGHFYTLASCNPNGCPAPNAIRKQLAGWIDQGLTDKEVFEALRKEHGPDMFRPHLLP